MIVSDTSRTSPGMGHTDFREIGPVAHGILERIVGRALDKDALARLIGEDDRHTDGHEAECKKNAPQHGAMQPRVLEDRENLPC